MNAPKKRHQNHRDINNGQPAKSPPPHPLKSVDIIPCFCRLFGGHLSLKSYDKGVLLSMYCVSPPTHIYTLLRYFLSFCKAFILGVYIIGTGGGGGGMARLYTPAYHLGGPTALFRCSSYFFFIRLPTLVLILLYQYNYYVNPG